MKLVKNIIKILFLFILLIAPEVKAQNTPINAYFFYGDGCPHCAQEQQYLFNVLKNEYTNLTIHEYEIYNNRANTLILQEIANKLNIKVDGVPFLVIGDEHFIGYAEGLTSKEIAQKVEQCSINSCPDLISEIVKINPNITTDNIPTKTINEQETVLPEQAHIDKQKIIRLPIIGDVDALNFSLPILTIIMGALDGFNPCAMWTLLFLISLLLGMKNRKRMWIIGITFIITSASVYFLFMAAWLNLILFLGFVIWVRTMIGVLAILGGMYSLKEFLLNKNNGCKVTGSEKRQQTFTKMKLAIQQNNLYLALGGIIILAFAVNLVELICSAGLPAIYTQVLALNEMIGWQYYIYILLYIFFFMLDDLLIFFAAMITLEMTGVTTKYAKISRLVGGIIMLTIGLMLMFKPELLMF